LLAKITEVTQVVTNKRKLRFMRIDLFNMAYSLYRSVLKNVATKTVNSVGGINDYSPSVKICNHRFD